MSVARELCSRANPPARFHGAGRLARAWTRARAHVRSGFARGRTRPLRLVGTCFLLAASGGCLVTDKIEYTEQDLAPSIRVISPDDIVQAFPATSQCKTTVGGDAAVDAVPTGPWVRFVVEVADPNVEDELAAWVALNGKHLQGIPDPDTIPTTNRADREPFEFCIPAQLLNPSCNRVDLIVMRKTDVRLSKADSYGVDFDADEGKYARAWWFVLGRTNDNPGLCTLSSDAGVFP